MSIKLSIIGHNPSLQVDNVSILISRYKLTTYIDKVITVITIRPNLSLQADTMYFNHSLQVYNTPTFNILLHVDNMSNFVANAKVKLKYSQCL